MRSGDETPEELRPATAGIEVVAGIERVRVTGRAAVSIAHVALHAGAINRIPVGRLAVDFAQAKTKVELTESFSAVRLDKGAARRGLGEIARWPEGGGADEPSDTTPGEAPGVRTDLTAL